MSPDQTRREFLEQLTHGAMAVAAGVGASGQGAAASAADVGQPARRPSSASLASLRRVFDAPPESAKPMTRWWWFGGAVTPAEITRELTFMRDAGLRGAEIQPVYPVTVDDPSHGVRHHRYYSAEWVDVLRHALSLIHI